MQSQILRAFIPCGAALSRAVGGAKKFDVARPTAKAAIEQLVPIGLLRRLRNKTARVPLLDAADVADLYLSRGVIERAVVRFWPHAVRCLPSGRRIGPLPRCDRERRS